ncbi:peptidoglycan DD-metalloendopeptidase family protein [Bacillus amyloliquefaciens]|nr:peptidoglycan DD-metalloendopeptidase family protein [Bacillus amyloliquefaciens]
MGDALTDVKTKIKPYGINNALIDISIFVEIKVKVIIPFASKTSVVTNNIHKGQIVKPGEVIGSVGSSGYGPPGTAGKFPPHLHYGMYKDNGRSEWSFDPYPHLRAWERKEIRKKK